MNIQNIIAIIKKEYLNKKLLNKDDLNPDNYINEYQLLNYLHTKAKDPHFWGYESINTKNIKFLRINKNGYVCIDMYYVGDMNNIIDNIFKSDNNKVILDLRGIVSNLHTVSILQTLFLFDKVHDFIISKILSSTKFTIYKHVDKDNNVLFHLYYNKNKIYYKNFIQNKSKMIIKDVANYKKIKVNKIKCICYEHTIASHLINYFGIEVYSNINNPIDYKLYENISVGKYRVKIPVAYVKFDKDYEFNNNNKIKEKYISF